MADDGVELAEYVNVYTIAPLPGVTEEQLERHIVDDELSFQVTHRPTGAVRLRHSFLKGADNRRADRYVWEIRLRFTQRVQAPDEAALERMDAMVRSHLESFGMVISMTAMQEIHAAESM